MLLAMMCAAVFIDGQHPVTVIANQRDVAEINARVLKWGYELVRYHVSAELACFYVKRRPDTADFD